MVTDPEWRELQQIGFRDPSGSHWSLVHRPENVDRLMFDDIISIKLARSSFKDQMFTGAVYRSADYLNGGTYKVLCA